MSKALAGAIAGAVVMAVTGAAGPAQSQEAASAFPSRNITLVVPQQAGASPDIAARLVAQPLQEKLGRPVVVENRPGASASLGASGVARAAADGYTMLFMDITVALAPSLLAKPGYDPVKSFDPVALVARSWMLLTVNPALPVKTLPELMALAKERPGGLKYGTPGVGSPPHLGGLVFLEATGLSILHVPYRGSPAAINDVVGGHIDMIFNSQGAVISQIEGGSLRALAVTGPSRLPKVPDVPTFREAGIDMKEIDQGVWFGIVVPAGTPRDIVMKLNGGVNAVLQEPATRQQLERDYKVEGGAPEVLGTLVKQQTPFWAGLIERAGVKPAAQ